MLAELATKIAPQNTAKARQRRVAYLNHIKKLSCGHPNTGNAIIHGDNLDVLEILQPHFAGEVRCIYIDPPYNNQEKYTHYHDNLLHEDWLESITDRIKCLANFLRDDGSLWISIDDRQMHYLKVAVDEIFGRQNFVTTIIWQQRTSRENRKVFSNNHEYILVYAKNLREFKNTRNLILADKKILQRYKNPDKDPRGIWQSISANVQAGHATASQFYEIKAPNGRKHKPPKGRCWVYNQKRMNEEIAKNNIWFGKDGNGVPRIKRFLNGERIGLTPQTLWTAEEVGDNDSAKKHLLQLFPHHPVFDTPKPEKLIQRIIEIASNPGELVMDVYLGSGTTAAVAHKLGRNYIGIENGEHAITHCAERLHKVVEGEDGAISTNIGWSGGGGFDFYKLAKTT